MVESSRPDRQQDATTTTNSGHQSPTLLPDPKEEKRYWATRATSYSKLEWASRQDYLNSVVNAGDLQPTDVVLDAGTGTGLVARAAAPHVAKVIGVDISPEMMRDLKGTPSDNCEFELGDIRALDFKTGHFSKAFSRMVFHGLITSVDAAAREIHRVLKPGGRFILSEGIPPDRCAEEWYTEMFRLKEERLTFFPETLEDILSRAGFSGLRTHIHVSPQVSIRNWLEHSGLPDSRQQEIMQTHLAMPQHIKKVYRATFSEDQDVLLDMKFAIVVGSKTGG